MTYVSRTNQPGRVIIQPVRRVGRKKNFGTLAAVQGHMAVCVGYTDDGTQAVYIPKDQLKHIKGAAERAQRSLLFRIHERLLRHYESQQA